MQTTLVIKIWAMAMDNRSLRFQYIKQIEEGITVNQHPT